MVIDGKDSEDIKMLTKELIAKGAAEEAWGRIVLWNSEGRIKGDLTFREVEAVYEPLILAAINQALELKSR